MPNIASVFKDEIIRVARKEMRHEMASLKKAATAHRAEIAALKRRAVDLEKAVRGLAKSRPAAGPAAAGQDSHNSQTSQTSQTSQKPIRFSATGLASQRKRLALSAEECGLLVGASGQSVYNWEAGKARPRTVNLTAISALKTMGKKEAVARLAALRAAPDKPARPESAGKKA